MSPGVIGMADPDAEAYRLLTARHTLVVLDTETTNQPVAQRTDGHPIQRLIQLGTVTITDGSQGRPQTRLVAPGVPITNSYIHGISDSAMFNKPDFAGIAPALDALLSPGADGTSVVLVCHYAPYDVQVLRGEYARLDREMPNVAVIDTMDLARYVGHDTGRRRSLEALAVSLDVNFVPEHDAGKDAAATAACLVRLLRMAARNSIVDLDDILDAIGTPAHDLPPPNVGNRTRGETIVELPAHHLATHTWVLPADPDAETIDTWVGHAERCTTLRCPSARARADEALVELAESPGGQKVARTLLYRLSDPSELTTLEAGQAGTRAGILAGLVPLALHPKDGSNQGGKGPQAIRWWRDIGPTIKTLPRCRPTASAGEDGQVPACPDCLAAQPCPLDTLHEDVAYTHCDFTHDGRLENATITRLVAHKDKGAHLWAQKGPEDIAGHIYWLVINHMLELGRETRASGTLAKATEVGIWRHDPRMALLHLQSLLGKGLLDDIPPVLAACKRPPGNTNPGYTDLEDWAAGPYATALARTKPTPARVLTKPRQSRPEGRERPNRFKR